MVAAGATTHAVALQYLGETISVGESYRKALAKAWFLIVAAVIVWVALIAAIFLSFIIIGIPLFLLLLVSWAFTTQAIMIDGEGPTSALGRSYDLVKGSRCRVLGIGIVFFLIAIGLTILIGILSAIFGISSTAIGSLVSNAGIDPRHRKNNSAVVPRSTVGRAGDEDKGGLLLVCGHGFDTRGATRRPHGHTRVSRGTLGDWCPVGRRCRGGDAGSLRHPGARPNIRDTGSAGDGERHPERKHGLFPASRLHVRSREEDRGSPGLYADGFRSVVVLPRHLPGPSRPGRLRSLSA